jgi:hypothetical protein
MSYRPARIAKLIHRSNTHGSMGTTQQHGNIQGENGCGLEGGVRCADKDCSQTHAGY